MGLKILILFEIYIRVLSDLGSRQTFTPKKMGIGLISKPRFGGFVYGLDIKPTKFGFQGMDFGFGCECMDQNPGSFWLEFTAFGEFYSFYTYIFFFLSSKRINETYVFIHKPSLVCITII